MIPLYIEWCLENHIYGKIVTLRLLAIILQSFLEGGQNTQGNTHFVKRQNEEKRLKERPSRACPNWGSIPYAAIKHKHYCRC